MTKPTNHPGQRIGQLTLIRQTTSATSTTSRCARWECRCDCGNAITLDSKQLKLNRLKMCRECRWEHTHHTAALRQAPSADQIMTQYAHYIQRCRQGGHLCPA